MLQKILVSPSSGQHHDTSILIIPLIIHTAEPSETLEYFLQTTRHPSTTKANQIPEGGLLYRYQDIQLPASKD